MTREPDDATLAGEGSEESERKPVDLRFTKVEQSGVRLERDLSGQGHLARGSHTHMSNMRFSVRAQPRDELDPELQALRSAALSERTPEPVTSPAALAPQEAQPAAPTTQAQSPPEPESGGMFAAFKRLFS